MVPITVVFPEAVKAQGNISVTVVQTIADMDAPSLATEINAATSVNVSCYLYSGGVGTKTTSKGEAPRRLCSTDTFQQFGNTAYEVSDLVYLYDPQGDGADEANEAMTALVEGSDVYLVVRRGLDAKTTAYAATQKVDIWHVRLGPQNRGVTGDGEFDEFAITQPVIVLDTPTFDATIAA